MNEDVPIMSITMIPVVSPGRPGRAEPIKYRNHIKEEVRYRILNTLLPSTISTVISSIQVILKELSFCLFVMVSRQIFLVPPLPTGK